MEEKIEILKLTVATYNILNTADRYEERRDFLKDTLFSMKADIIGLQEVAFGKGGQIDYLVANEKGDPMFDVYNAETQLKYQEQYKVYEGFRVDGDSLLIAKTAKVEILSHEVLHLSGFRSAHRVLVKLANGIMVWIVNCHLHHTVEETMIRTMQATDMCEWMKSASKVTGNVIMLGDFNTQPHEQAYSVICDDYGYISTYVALNGTEPKKTWPTGTYEDKDEGVYDYIWYKGENVRALAVKLVGDKPKPDDNTLYASDHLGLVAEFEFCS